MAPRRVGRLIQRAEEEGPEQVALDFASLRQRAVDMLAEKMRVGIEPALGLDEIEEEDAGELEQCEAVTVVRGDPLREGGAHPVQRAAERREETAPHRFGIERPRHVRRRAYRAIGAATAQSFQRTKRERRRAIETGDQHGPRRHAH